MNIKLAGIVVAVGLGSAACSATPAPAPVTSSAAPAATTKAVPQLEGAQITALLADMRKVDPGLVTDKAAGNARNTCQQILDGTDETTIVRNTKLRFQNKDVATLTDAQATQIVASIRSNGFCK